MSENGKNGVVLKWAHIIVALVIQVTLIAAMFGRILFQVEDNTRRIDKLESATSGAKEIREEILRRLDKLEAKIELALSERAKK